MQEMKKMIRFLGKYKKHFLIITAMMMTIAAIDVSLTYMTKYAIDEFVVKGTTQGLGFYMMKYAMLVIGLGITIFVFIERAGQVESGLSYDIRKALFEKAQMLSISYYDKNQAGWIMARMTSDVTKLGEFISWGLVDLVWGFSMMIGILAVMISVDYRLALIIIAVIPPLAVTSMFFQKKIIKLQKVVRKLNSRVTGMINELILGVKTTKTLGIEDVMHDDFKNLTQEMRSTSMRSAHYGSMFQPVVINLAAIATVIVIYRGGSGVASGVITYGTLVLFINYSIQFFEPVRELARIIADMQSALVSVERVFSLLDHEIDVKDSLEVEEKYGDILNPKYENFRNIKGEVEFKDVSFHYNPAEPVLKNFSLKIEKGTSLALVGETGSGKSTIVSLMNRFYDAVSGEILIDGTDISEYSLSNLHQMTGYVLQTPHLFSGTIIENIRYGNQKISDDRIFEICKTLGIHQMIEEFDKGYDTQVGEGGSLLSTGQRQLISFARAVATDPSIMILDEATSSIDTHSEMLIQSAIPKLLSGRTSIIIAHRLSTIKNSDMIVLIDGGEILEMGTHDQLIARKGNYYELYRNQYIHEGESRILDQNTQSA